MSGRAGVRRPSSNACGFGQDVVAAIGDLAQLFDRFIEVASLGGVPHRAAVKGAVQEFDQVDMLRFIERVFYVPASDCDETSLPVLSSKTRMNAPRSAITARRSNVKFGWVHHYTHLEPVCRA